MSYQILIAGVCPDAVTRLLAENEYRVTTAGCAAAASTLAARHAFDLFIVDSTLPCGDGFHLCREFRRQHRDTPILVMTPRYDAAANILALKMGADDCVAPCFDSREILARISALLRRTARCRAASLSVFEFGGVSVDFARGIVRRSGQTLPVPRKELELLRYLVARRGTVVSRRELLCEVWGYQTTATRTIDVHLACLRQKLESDPKTPQYLLTVRGEGYLFRVSVNQSLRT